MGVLASFLIALLDVVESEARAARSGMVRVLIAGVFLICSLGFLAAGLGLFVWGVYVALKASQAMGPAGAAFACGVLSLFLAAVLIAVARWTAR